LFFLSDLFYASVSPPLSFENLYMMTLQDNEVKTLIFMEKNTFRIDYINLPTCNKTHVNLGRWCFFAQKSGLISLSNQL